MSTLATTPAPAPRVASAASRTSPARDPRVAGGGLVLTRRGRLVVRATVLVVTSTALAAGLVLLWLAAASVVAPGAVAGDGGQGVRSGVEVADVVSTTAVVVGPGDTLWEIARTHAPDRDPRSVVDQVVELNGLTSTGVQVGDSVLVPTR